MKRKYEEITKIEFDRLVKSIFPNASLVWHDVPQHIEPPDWYLTLDKNLYAVEATSVVDFLSFTFENRLSVINISTTLFAFIKEIEKSAKEEGILSGAYIVSLCPIPNFSANRKAIASHLLNYIRQTKTLQSAPEHTLGYVRHQRLSIIKEHDNKDYVYAAISMGAKWEGEAQQALLQSVSKAISEKAHKLRNVSEPFILLLLDGFQYSFMTDWTSVIASCPDRFHFSCICRISPPDSSVIVWAKSAEWKAILGS
jgi:hypothetical protein